MDNTPNNTYDHNYNNDTFFSLDHSIFGSDNQYSSTNNVASQPHPVTQTYYYEPTDSTLHYPTPSTDRPIHQSNIPAPLQSSTIASQSNNIDITKITNIDKENVSSTKISIPTSTINQSLVTSNKSVISEYSSEDSIDLINVGQPSRTIISNNSNKPSETQNSIEIADSSKVCTNIAPNDLITSMNLNISLYKILFEMNSINAPLYYNKCHFAKVNEEQIVKLTEFQISRMFADNEIGLMADFIYDLNTFKAKRNIGSKINIPTTIQNKSNMLPYEQFSKYSSSSNPNCLLKIISNDVALYKKTIERSSDDSKKTLTSGEQFTLLNLIKNHFVNRCDKKMTHSDMKLLAEQIEEFFPGEDKQTFFKIERREYFCKEKQKMIIRNRAAGKLVAKWANRREKEPRQKKVSDQDHYVTIPVIVENISNAEHQEILRVNLCANQNYPINVIMDEWKKCQELRLKCISNNKENPHKIFSAWPHYEHGDGHILVSTFGFILIAENKISNFLIYRLMKISMLNFQWLAISLLLNGTTFLMLSKLC